jgi:cytochrome P450/NADPH-cytochrome P450 reductase
VRQAFIELFVARTGAAVLNGKTWLAGLVANQRYLEDVWASATGFTSSGYGSAEV